MNWNYWILQKNAEVTLSKLGVSRQEYIDAINKAKVDKGLSPREKMKAREARSYADHQPEEIPEELVEPSKTAYRTDKMSAKMFGDRPGPATGTSFSDPNIDLKTINTLQHATRVLQNLLQTHKMKNQVKMPTSEDLEYPKAA
jgi:hypothetical protein